MVKGSSRARETGGCRRDSPETKYRNGGRGADIVDEKAVSEK